MIMKWGRSGVHVHWEWIENIVSKQNIEGNKSVLPRPLVVSVLPRSVGLLLHLTVCSCH